MLNLLSNNLLTSCIEIFIRIREIQRLVPLFRMALNIRIRHDSELIEPILVWDQKSETQ